ncbi:hypothetical protein, partial [Enterobacter hormaechei]|uniref:hypothetical protein n=1 Tax=Enterobacter hormaechei TaxID=158836 RepID=UPI001953CA0E
LGQDVAPGQTDLSRGVFFHVEITEKFLVDGPEYVSFASLQKKKAVLPAPLGRPFFPHPCRVLI